MIATLIGLMHIFSEESPEIYVFDTSSDIPKLYLTGAIDQVSKNAEVPMSVEYIAEDMSFACYAELHTQGASSVKYKKKNYTITFYSNAVCSNKAEISLNNWSSESKYCLKANYVDYTMSRNIVSAKLWGDMVQSRGHLSENLASLVNGGAIDGYPILLYANDQYMGIYTLNIPKDEWSFGMGNNECEAMLFASNWSDSVAFKTLADFDADDNRWIVEYCSSGDTTWVQDSLNNLISFVIHNDGEEFRDGISTYLDVDAAIDFYIFTSLIYADDNSSKNAIWVTYDGVLWIPSVYDLDTTYGLQWEGMNLNDADGMLPFLDTAGVLHSGTSMLLWDRLLNIFSEEIAARYWELRKGILSDKNIKKMFNDFMNSIPDDVWAEELKRWPDIPSADITSLDQIGQFMAERTVLLDNFYELLASNQNYMSASWSEFLRYQVSVSGKGGNTYYVRPNETVAVSDPDSETVFSGWYYADTNEAFDPQMPITGDTAIRSVSSNDMTRSMVDKIISIIRVRTLFCVVLFAFSVIFISVLVVDIKKYWKGGKGAAI